MHSHTSCIALLASLVACGNVDAPNFDNRIGTRMRPLETIDYDLLDGAAIHFVRLDLYPEGHWPGFYFIDGTARVTKNGWIIGGTAPALSPDGRRVAFLAQPQRGDVEFFWDIAIADVDSLAHTRVVREPGNREGAPTWSVDGRLLFALDEGHVTEGAQASIYLQQPTFGAARELVHRFLWPFGELLHCDTPWIDAGYAEPPAVAANGDIAFMCNWLALHVKDQSTGTVRTIYTIPGSSTGDRRLLYAPAMSPDGSSIFFIEAPQIAKPDSIGMQLRIVNKDGTGMRVLATMAYGPWGEFVGHNTFSACWLSPNHIAFTVPAGDLVGHVYVVAAAGGTPTQLTTKPDVVDRSVSCARNRLAGEAKK